MSDSIKIADKAALNYILATILTGNQMQLTTDELARAAYDLADEVFTEREKFLNRPSNAEKAFANFKHNGFSEK